jgi:transposase-like protein
MSKLRGRRFARKRADLCHRGGWDPGSVMVRGQREEVRKPRAKRGGQEAELATYRALQGLDLLSDRILGHRMAGVSTRKYDRLLDEVSGGLGLKRSSVSRAFVRGSRLALEEINGRDLSQEEWLGMMIDSLTFADRSVTVAMGITVQGRKKILGLKEGDTENWEIVRDLIQSLVERGLSPEVPLLFVMDGFKAFLKAIRKVFADRVPLQRYIRHKERNILKYLLQSYHAEFRRRWKALHSSVRSMDAQREHDRLVAWLQAINQAALASLEEAEGDTLTVLRLHVPPALRRTLLSTNRLESSFDGVRSRSEGNVAGFLGGGGCGSAGASSWGWILALAILALVRYARPPAVNSS